MDCRWLLVRVWSLGDPWLTQMPLIIQWESSRVFVLDLLCWYPTVALSVLSLRIKQDQQTVECVGPRSVYRSRWLIDALTVDRHRRAVAPLSPLWMTKVGQPMRLLSFLDSSHPSHPSHPPTLRPRSCVAVQEKIPSIIHQLSTALMLTWLTGDWWLALMATRSLSVLLLLSWQKQKTGKEKVQIALLSFLFLLARSYTT